MFDGQTINPAKTTGSRLPCCMLVQNYLLHSHILLLFACQTLFFMVISCYIPQFPLKAHGSKTINQPLESFPFLQTQNSWLQPGRLPGGCGSTASPPDARCLRPAQSSAPNRAASDRRSLQATEGSTCPVDAEKSKMVGYNLGYKWDKWGQCPLIPGVN